MQYTTIKKTALLCSLLLLVTTTLAGCGGETQNADVSDTTQMASDTGASGTSSEDAAQSAADMLSVQYEEDDLDDSWDDDAATHITFSEATAFVEGSGAEARDSLLTISAGGTYVLSGMWDDGQIVVDAGENDNIHLVLNGADISCSNGAPLYIIECDKIVITLAGGTENAIADGTVYVYDEDTGEPDAALYSNADLTLNGEGALTVNANYSHGIVGKDDLVITGGYYSVYAVNDGIQGKDSVSISGGTFTIEAGGDAIQSNNDEDAEKGWISLDGGVYSLTAENDGIQAETILQITDGAYTVTTGGGAASTESGFGFNDDETGASAKGLKGGTAVFITGGSFSIDSSDDAIHTNGSATLTGGTFSLSSGDDGVHADNTLSISGGTVDILQSYEGLEGNSIIIGGGVIHVTASDDGLNAAGGRDGSAFEGGGFRQDAFSVDSDTFIQIEGGYLSVIASGDGIDSNGNLYVSGGTVLVSGPTNSGNGALDYNGTGEITGGVFIAAGSSGMAETFSDSSTQCSLLISFTSEQAAGTLVNLSDADGNSIITYSPAKQYQSVVISTPELTQGQTYALSSGGSDSGELSDGLYTGGAYSPGTQLTDITLSSVSTSVSDSGDAISGGGMNFGGMNQGGGARGGQRPGGVLIRSYKRSTAPGCCLLQRRSGAVIIHIHLTGGNACPSFHRFFALSTMACLSLSGVDLSISQAITIIPAILKPSRSSIYRQPRLAVSNKSMGIFVADQAPMKIKTLKSPAPFFISKPATGNAAYKGPAAAAPIKKAITPPLRPACRPIYFIMVSRSTQTSMRPKRTKIGGRTEIISSRLSFVTEK